MAADTPPSHRPLPVRIVATSVLLIWFLSWCWSALLLPFVNVLPYLQSFRFFERLTIAVAFFIFTVVVACWASTSTQWQNLVKAHAPGWKGKASMVLALIFGALIAAWLSANFLGSLAWASPGQPYTERFKIEHVQFNGSKYRSVNLDLVSLKNQKRYSLALSKRLFNYPKFIALDQIVLYGKQTVFGVYIEHFEQPIVSPLR